MPQPITFHSNSNFVETVAFKLELKQKELFVSRVQSRAFHREEPPDFRKENPLWHITRHYRYFELIFDCYNLIHVCNDKKEETKTFQQVIMSDTDREKLPESDH